MSPAAPFRPWGELPWALALSAARRWRFFGCVAAEERSTAALVALHRLGALERVEMHRILDPEPADLATEDRIINERVAACAAAGCTINPVLTPLDAPLQNSAWRQTFTFPANTSLCLDVSSLPKRFFFAALKAALQSAHVRDLLIVYSKPLGYPRGPLASNPRDWSTLTGFDADDPDTQKSAASHQIVGAGFAVEGLHDYLEGRGNRTRVDVMIPFPATPWDSVQRSWDSARGIAAALGVDTDHDSSKVQPTYHRVGALDTATAFDCLLSLTNGGRTPAALAPLGPKPLSVAMCLLAAQTGRHPVYYAQPRTYALNHSLGFKTTYAYWIKHDGVNFYSL